MFEQFFKGICDLVYPQHCFICKRFHPSDKKHNLLCPYCESTVRSNIPPFCLKCSRHLPEDTESGTCKTCRKTSPYFDSAWGASLYNQPMRRLIHLFKYGNKTGLRHYFGKVLQSFLKQYKIDIDRYDKIVPIPLHPVRMRERGFNQSQLLAEAIAPDNRNLKPGKNLIRIKNTQNQARLRDKDRWTNIEGAFKIKRPSEFSDKSILLIDDLMTTGATASEAARVLREAEAKRVDVLTLAITNCN